MPDTLSQSLPLSILEGGDMSTVTDGVGKRWRAGELCGEGCPVVLAVEMGGPFQADGSRVMGEEPEVADSLMESPAVCNKNLDVIQ